MPDNEFVQDSICYVPSTVAAKRAGLSPTDVTRICRVGLVVATWHARQWYVSEASLDAFLAQRRREEHDRALAEDAQQKAQQAAARPTPVTVVPHPRVREHPTAVARERGRKPFAATIATITLLVSLGGAFALTSDHGFAGITEQVAAARASLTRNVGLARDAAQTQLAAAEASGFTQWIGDLLFALFGDKPQPNVPTPRPPIAPEPTQTDQTTTSQFVNTPPPSRPSPASSPTPPKSASNPSNIRDIANTGTPAAPAAPPAPQPTIQRVIETVRTVVENGVNAAYVDDRIAAVQQALQSQLAAVAAASNTKSETIYQTLGAVARIENLDDVTITNSRWTGGSISGASISGTVSNTIDSLLATITDLTSTTITATNVTFTNAPTTNATTTNFAIIGLPSSLLTTNAQGTVVATSSLGVAFGGTGLTSAPSYGQLLLGNASGGYTLTATSSLGLPTFGYPFPNNATTTGLVLAASTTIGNGAQAGGLTINGGATTTGNEYFGGNIGIGQTDANTSLFIKPSVGTYPLVIKKATDNNNLFYVDPDGGTLTAGTAVANGFRAGNLTIDGTANSIGYNGVSYGLKFFNTGNATYRGDTTEGTDLAASLAVQGTGTADPFLVATTSGTAQFIVKNNGNVGIGTTSPYAKLSVVGPVVAEYFNATSSTASLFTGGLTAFASSTIGNGTQANGLTINGGATTTGNAYFAGNVGIGTSMPGALLDVNGTLKISGNVTLSQTQDQTFTGTGLNTYTFSGGRFIFNDTNSGISFQHANVETVRINSDGNVGIGTTSPWRTLSVTGTVGFDGLTGSTGAGSLCLSSSKQVVYNSGSDACLPSLRSTKHAIDPLTLDALGQVLALQPVSFVYNEGDGRTRYGFIAEDTATVDDHLATHNASGAISGIDDRALLSIVVKAIQEISGISGAFKTNLTEWFADAENGITDFFAKRGHFQEQLCVGDTCVTPEQFKAVFGNSQPAAAGAADTQTGAATGDPPAAGNPNADSTTTTTPSVIEPTTSGASSTPDKIESELQPTSAAANDNTPPAQSETTSTE